ncbi:MAG TPA: glycosyltransferase family A protein [Vicinamibacterales bacterium]|jgi:glycosyltransferase involved in cell wall biosynthesis
MNAAPIVSVVLPTYNRGSALTRAVQSVLDQTASPESYEIVVVDNNSTDETPRVIQRLAQANPSRIEYVLETRQGVAYARGAGIARARADIVAFFDDDVCVSPEWIETIVRTFAEHPEVECIGGKVLPEWSAPPPPWLTPSHWAPLALQDFGDAPMTVSHENPRGLISANLACRKSVFDRVGGFSPQFQRVKDGIGSLEDDEWIRRLWKAGGRALYVPELVTTTEIPSTRLTREYHRRWHRGHGKFYALLRAEEMEATSMGSLFGVPAHMYRSALGDVAGWISAAFMGRYGRAFEHEVKLRFFRGFFTQRFLERLYS